MGHQRGAIERWQATGLNTSLRLLPEILNEEGYKTHMVNYMNCQLYSNLSWFRLENGILATAMKLICHKTEDLKLSLDSTPMLQTTIQGTII